VGGSAHTGGLMRIGLNLTFLAPDSGGSATYAAGLIRGIRAVRSDARFTAWVGRDAPQPAWLEDVEVIRLPVKGVGGVAHYAWDLGGMVAQARRRRLDVLHGLAFVAPPVHPGVPVAVTILDTTWQRFPASMDWQGRVVFGTMARVLGRTASRVIAISEAGRDDLVNDLRIPRDRIDVTPLAVDPPARAVPADPGLRERLGLGPDPIVLCIAQKRAHKNLEAAVEAIARLDVPAQLVLPGSPNAYEERLRALAIDRGARDRVRFIGWVGDEDLEGLYGIADALVFPSLMEGFGLPILEAMTRGVPVACSNISALPEVAGDAALLFDPHDHAAIAADLRRLLTDADLRSRLAQAGRERAAEFTWERTAQATLASYERAIG